MLGVGNSHNKKQQNRQCTRRPNCHARKLAFYGNSVTAYTAAVLSVRIQKGGKILVVIGTAVPCIRKWLGLPSSCTAFV